MLASLLIVQDIAAETGGAGPHVVATMQVAVGGSCCGSAPGVGTSSVRQTSRGFLCPTLQRPKTGLEANITQVHLHVPHPIVPASTPAQSPETALTAHHILTELGKNRLTAELLQPDEMGAGMILQARGCCRAASGLAKRLASLVEAG